jgi:adenylate cyclase, class 2
VPDDAIGDDARVSGSENIELKAADADPAASERACRALGAVDGGVLRQRDTYFALERGLLKLREDIAAGTGELIFYLRAHAHGARASSYWRAPASDPAAWRALLGAAHGVSGVVTKRRRLFLHRNVRIHLDDVEGLGCFVELESVLAVPGEESADEARALAEVIAALGLAGRHAARGSVSAAPVIGAFVTTRRQTWSAPAAMCSRTRSPICSTVPSA